MINNQGNITSLLYKYRPSIVTVRITLSVDKDGKLFVTNNKNRVNMFQLKCDPEQKKRVIQIVSEILEDMDSILPF